MSTPAEYINASRIDQVTRICQLAPYVAMVYDHILTIDQEVEHIWRSLSLSTVLYVMLRYGGTAATLVNAFGASLHLSFTHVRLISIVCPAFLAQASASNELYVVQNTVAFPICVHPTEGSTGKVFIVLQGWPGSLTVWLVQFILQMRLYALYNHSRKLLYLMGGAYIVEIATMSTILVIANVIANTVNEPASGIFICDDLNTPKIFYSFWLAPLVFESILCLLAIWIGIQRSKEHFRPASIRGTRLVNVVIMGNVGYFVGILLACIVNAAMWQNLSSQWMEVPEGFFQAIEIIAGCRLILHTRSAATRDPNATITAPVQIPLRHLTPKSNLDGTSR
ncbi:hypothetical protein HYDPIDRAFT_32614 [Hydnomerulius pinastri MD-312]|uniref:DUF6533 domain-containing protein n=1 Tax=Hydnomerulius pinastri MD-312 TaxID=994086 RepID=A0A0C9VQN2_9AGAM|nr:hypothetical protein HYDPIDRAFT_32614 [Hydnomerulius pinastri MD-312]